MKLTIFTPTYNRAGLLKRVYESLCNQTNTDFCWLIVDDGSTDDTRSVIQEFKDKEDKFEIKYIYTENGGKMHAHNIGVMNCNTEWFMCLDSDDFLCSDCVEKIYKAFELKASKSADKNAGGKNKIAGLIANKGESETKPLYNQEIKMYGEYSLSDLYKAGFRGETTIVFYTEVIRNYPFPTILGEKYVPEDYIYDKIDQKYAYLVIPDILTVCEIVEKGYTDSVRALKLNNRHAWFLYYEQRARIKEMSLLKFKYLGFYVLYGRMLKLPVFDSSKACELVYESCFDKSENLLGKELVVQGRIRKPEVCVGFLSYMFIRLMKKF